MLCQIELYSMFVFRRAICPWTNNFIQTGVIIHAADKLRASFSRLQSRGADRSQPELRIILFQKSSSIVDQDLTGGNYQGSWYHLVFERLRLASMPLEILEPR